MDRDAKRILCLLFLVGALVYLTLTKLASSATAQISGGLPDPGDEGPFGVTQIDYNFGDAAFISPEFPYAVEDRARLFYPTSLPGSAPLPLIIFLHGKHPVCHNGVSAQTPEVGGLSTWPCTTSVPTRTPTPNPDLFRYPIWNYQGYDYIARNLASHGYIVISISANGINARDAIAYVNGEQDFGMKWRAQLIHHHLDYWNSCNAAPCAQLGDIFVGKVDLQRVGLVGHSRGGEGATRALNTGVMLQEAHYMRASN